MLRIKRITVDDKIYALTVEMAKVILSLEDSRLVSIPVVNTDDKTVIKARVRVEKLKPEISKWLASEINKYVNDYLLEFLTEKA